MMLAFSTMYLRLPHRLDHGLTAVDDIGDPDYVVEDMSCSVRSWLMLEDALTG
jgi:hypothetical protein